MVDHHVNRKSGLPDDDHRLPLDDRHRMGCFCGVYLSWIVNRAIQNHGHRVDLSIDPPCYDVDDQNLDVMTDVSLYLHMNDRLVDQNLDANHVNRNCAPHDPKMAANLDGNRDLRMSDPLDDLNLVVNRDLRRNDPLGDHLRDGDRHDVPVGHRMNVKDDLNLGASRVNRNYAPHDQNLVAKTGGTTDASLCLRLNDRLDDLSLDASRANRNCVRRDQMKDVNLDAMSHRVMYY
jgi:hypothetical protein